MGVRLRKERLSYSRANELLKKELLKDRLDPAKFGIHNLHAGDASAASALRVPERLY